MALTYSDQKKLGMTAPDFQLPGVDGKTYSLKDFQSAKVLVVVFMCNHCPYVIATQNRINNLARQMAPRGVQWVGINANDSVKYPADNFENMKLRAKEEGFVFPYLWDETQKVAKDYGAVCTPDFYVFSNRGMGRFELLYQGRLDDNWKDEKAVTRQELALAVDEILAGRVPNPDQKASMGCSIKWK